jgi:YqaJ-like viral recombinase domain
VIVLDLPQRSDEWVQARLGRVTSSRAADMLATIKKGEAASRRNYRMQLVLERVMGRSMENGYVSREMQIGIEREPEARGAYEALTGNLLQTVGFCQHDSVLAGCSPDGYVGDWDGLVEIKSPLPATHWEYLKTGVVPDDYYKQVVCALWITGAPWCDWLSYHPDFPESLRVKLVRIHRDDAEIASFELATTLFLREVEAEVEAVQALANPVFSV